jgi:hypothetical protein
LSDEEREDRIAARVRAHLDRASDELDSAALARLRAIRLRALDALPAARDLWSRRLAIAGAGALALLVAVSWWARGRREGDLPGDALEDVEILAAADDLELYDDDPEFYRWLDESEPI